MATERVVSSQLDEEAPWTLIHPALSEHDPVIYRLPYDRRTHEDVDPVAEATMYLKQAAERHYLDKPKQLGKLVLQGIADSYSAYAQCLSTGIIFYL